MNPSFSSLHVAASRDPKTRTHVAHATPLSTERTNQPRARPLCLSLQATIDELLDGAGGSVVQMCGTLNEPETTAKLTEQGVRVIADYFEAAAPYRTLRSKRADDHVTAGLHCAGDLTYISGAVARSSQKMEARAIMPHIEPRGFKLDICDVRRDPVNPFGVLS